MDDEGDTATQWPVIDSYTTADGFVVRVFKAAYAVAAINKFSVRPKGISVL